MLAMMFCFLTVNRADRFKPSYCNFGTMHAASTGAHELGRRRCKMV
jgi:hypothetical protein